MNPATKIGIVVRVRMSASPDRFQFRVPWYSTEHPLHEELALEVSERHPLYGIGARAIARRQDNDDVLFELSGENAPAAFAVVHLTWSGKPDQFPEFPSAELYPTFSDWIVGCMLPDADDWELTEGGTA
jgi:hypothetical protein